MLRWIRPWTWRERFNVATRSSKHRIRHIVATRIVSRPELARYLDDRFAIGAQLQFQTRAERGRPHLGRLDLRTRYSDSLATPLPSVIPS